VNGERNLRGRMTRRFDNSQARAVHVDVQLAVFAVTVDIVLLKQNLNAQMTRAKGCWDDGAREYLCKPLCVAEKENLFSVSRVAEKWMRSSGPKI
jgi:hypothetical protein